MKHNTVVTIAIVFAVIILVALIIRNHTKKLDQAEVVPTEETTSEETKGQEDIATEIEAGVGYDSDLANESVNAFGCVQIESIYTEVVDDGSEEANMNYTKYYLSDIDMDCRTDVTSDYLNAVAGDEFDDEKITSVSFSEAFGFDYASCNSLGELFEQARNANGFDADLSDATFDSEKYKIIGEESYILNQDSSVLKTLIGNEDYDKLLQSKCMYSLAVDENGNKYPNKFTAIVQYEKKGVIYTKTAYLGFSFYNEGDGDCACSGEASTDSCGNCGENGACGDCDKSDSCGNCNKEGACPSCGGVGGCTDDCDGACCN